MNILYTCILEQTSYLHHFQFSFAVLCFSAHQSSEDLLVHKDNIFQLIIVVILILVWFTRDWYCKENPVVDHLAISVTLVQLSKCHMLSNHYFERSPCSFDHWSPLLSHCTSLEVIIFTAFSVGASGNKSIEAWLSSKDCVRLGSSGIEPTLQKKNILSRSESRISLEDSVETDWFQCHIEHIKSAGIFCSLLLNNNLFCYAISLTQQEPRWHSLGFQQMTSLHFHTNYKLHCLFFSIFKPMSCIKTRQQCNKWWEIKTIFHETLTVCPQLPT